MWTSTTPHLHIKCMALIKNEFDLRKLDTCDPVTGTLIRNKITKLKYSLLDSVNVTILNNDLNMVAEKYDQFMFPMKNDIPCILHIKNMISEKLVTM